MTGKKAGNAAVGWVVVIVIFGFCMVGGYALEGGFGDNSTDVPAPTSTEAADTVSILSKATEAQGICYGWRLRGGPSDAVSTGSNLGEGVAVDSDPARCPRWVEVDAEVTYTSASSEADDWAFVTVKSSSDDVSGIDLELGLKRLGLDEAAFVDEPGWAVTRAAVSLPLLMAEQRLAPAAPVSTDAPAAASSPLPDPAPDLWRDRWGYLLAGAAMLLVTVVLVAIGRVQARRQRAAEVPKQGATTADLLATSGRKTSQRR